MSSHGAGDGERGGVQVIERAAAILRTLAESPDGLSLSQIAERVGLPRSTVHRLASALQTERLVASASPAGRLRLGPGLASLAMRADRDVVHRLHPFLVALSAQLEETVDLSVLTGTHVLFIDHVAAPRRLRAVSAVGALFPAHCPAPGKALLAALANEELERILPSSFERLTPGTVVDRERLLAELDTVRGEGVAYDREEHTVGICGVAGIVRGASGWFGSLSVPLPAPRFYGSEERLAAAVREACASASRSLASLTI